MVEPESELEADWVCWIQVGSGSGGSRYLQQHWCLNEGVAVEIEGLGSDSAQSHGKVVLLELSLLNSELPA